MQLSHVDSKPDLHGLHVIHEDKETGFVTYCACYRDRALMEKRLPGGVIGAIARSKGAAPGQRNYH